MNLTSRVLMRLRLTACQELSTKQLCNRRDDGDDDYYFNIKNDLVLYNVILFKIQN